MIKFNSKNIFNGLIIGLGILLIIIALGIASSRTAGQNKLSESTPTAIADKPEDQANVAEKKDKISYIINKGEGQEILTFEYTLNTSIGQTVFDILKDISTTNLFDLKYNNNYSFGVFIESIASIKNGDNGKYWQYYVNDKLGDVAADKHDVKIGDKVEWKFEAVPEF